MALGAQARESPRRDQPAGAVGEALSRGNRSLHRRGGRRGPEPQRRPDSGNRG
nr:MAG TPA: hypothetical protein [Caudoviricetes sp.]